MSKILVVDDEPSILDSIEMALQYEGHSVTTALTGALGLEAFRASRPDLVILDRMLPDGDGLSVCREIRRTDQVPILMLTARTELDDKVDGLDTGADDYMTKPFRVKELQARVRALLRRGAGVASAWQQAGALSVSTERREVLLNDAPVDLTSREFDLLAYLMTQPGRVFTKEQILEAVWGWEDMTNPNVVEVYVSTLRTKLGQRDLIRTVRGVGYSFNDRS